MEVDNENDDDVVIKEYDVYLSNSLANNLHVFQFPIKPSNMTYDEATVLASRIKPAQKKVELEIGINTETANYSQTKGEQFALNVDGRPGLATSSQQKYYKSNLMDKQVFVSSNATPMNMNKHYKIGIIRNNEIHLTPVQSIVQMRPSFEYFDIYEKKVKDVKESLAEAEYSTEEEEPEDKTELITMRYAKDSGKTSAQQETEQNWINTTYVNTNEPEAKIKKELLFCKNKTNEVTVEESKEAFLNKLLSVPNAQNEASKTNV